MCFTPYKPEVVGQEESIIFGPTTLHGDAVKIKCEQMGINNYEEFLEEIMEKIHDQISRNKFIKEQELEELIHQIVNA